MKPDELKKFENSQIVGFSIQPKDLSINIEFILDGTYTETDIEFSHVALYSFSSWMEGKNYDNDPNYYVGEINYRELGENDAEIFKKLNYGHKLSQEDFKKNIHYFHIEGELCMDIICDCFSITDVSK